jgi:hypothetical protein
MGTGPEHSMFQEAILWLSMDPQTVIFDEIVPAVNSSTGDCNDWAHVLFSHRNELDFPRY